MTARAFTAWCLQQAMEGYDVDGGPLQDKAIGLGLLEPVKVTKPCGEHCTCAEWDDFPQTCYRIPGWLREEDQ